MKQSKFMSLNINDFLKGLLMAVITAIVTTVYTIVEQGGLDFSPANLKLIATSAVLAMLAYIMKQLGTHEDGRFLVKKKDNSIENPENTNEQ